MKRFEKIFIFILLFFVFLSGNSYAEVVQKIEIKGNERISKETIIVFGDISVGKDYNTPDINSLIKKLYTTSFFSDVSVSLKDNIFRNDKCHKQLFHTAPSYIMVTDALMQFLKKKNWTKLLLVSGTNNRDEQFKDSLKVSAKKFGLKITNEKKWEFTHDFRRTADLEFVKFTQGEKYEVLVLADEGNTFGDSGNSFGDYILNSSKTPIVPEEDVYDVMSVCFAAEEAMETSSTIKVNYIT